MLEPAAHHLKEKEREVEEFKADILVD